MNIIECSSDEMLHDVWGVMQQLRAGLDEATFIERVHAAKQSGYRLLMAFEHNQLVGAMGWRVLSDLAWGRTLYIDDLVVDEQSRNQGIGEKLMAHARDIAKGEKCACVRLSSNLQRLDAHRFYERIGMTKQSFSFREDL